MYNTNGYIKLHRSFLNWEWYKNTVVCKVYLHLLLTANFDEDVWHGRVYTAGQVVTSYQSLAEALGFSIQQVRTAVSNLKKTGYITVETTNKFSVITVENWEEIQNGTKTFTHRPTRKIAPLPQTNQQQNKNIINIKNKEIVKSAPAPKPKHQTKTLHIHNSGTYDYAQIRLSARERIRERIQSLNSDAV